jgi:hypothetical protein
MDHFAGLDVSVKETSICIVDGAGKIVREVKVASEPEALLAVLKNPAYHFKRIGLEAIQICYARAQSSNCAGICTGTDREIVQAPRPAAASDGRANFDDANYIIGRNV